MSLLEIWAVSCPLHIGVAMDRLGAKKCELLIRYHESPRDLSGKLSSSHWIGDGQTRCQEVRIIDSLP